MPTVHMSVRRRGKCGGYFPVSVNRLVFVKQAQSLFCLVKKSLVYLFMYLSTTLLRHRGGIAPPYFTSAPGGGEWAASRPRRFTPEDRVPPITDCLEGGTF
jgi:hypothetical protein